MLPRLHDFGVEDSDGDGVVDTVRARFYVPDDPTPRELAAAANLAARLAFETVSLDLPLGFHESAFESGRGIAVFVGRAAVDRADGVRLPNLDDCERLALTLGSNGYKAIDPNPLRGDTDTNLSNVVKNTRSILIGSQVRSASVIDLAARIALESTELHLPLVAVADDTARPPTPRSIVVGASHPYVCHLIDTGRLHRPETGARVVLDEGSVILVGADASAEAAAIRHVALRMPYLWTYGKGQTDVSSVENEVLRHCPQPMPQPRVIFDETHPLVWEVDEARQQTHKLLPLIRNGGIVNLDVRLSEPLEIRRQLENELLDTLQRAGASPYSAVRVLSAHKQGFCWIEEQLMPALSEASRIRIRYRECQLTAESVDTADRWLHEIYPIDEVLSRALGISTDHVTFERVSCSAAHVYEVLAEDADGEVILHATFDPAFVFRELFDVFPDYATATVSTGWVRATVDGLIALDERVRTDYERFWDQYQSIILPRVRDYIIHLHGGQPDADAAPHFDELLVEVHLSEPDYELGIDQERISTLEALHEDLYFETLLFFDVLGLSTCGKPLKYPGRIVPRVHPSRPGPGRCHVRLTGYETPVSTERPFAETNPSVVAIDVDENGATALELAADAPFCWLLEKRLTDSLRSNGPFGTIVPWDEPIGPEECERILAKLARFPQVRPFIAGRSWMGRPIWAIDVVAAGRGQYFSTSKAIATKPCLFITGRQHANEVSSTSHILKLVELLVLDDAHRKILDRVNFIIQPITNPDGAALVEELHKLTPGFMLHAGYLGALGVDVTDGQWSTTPKYPEARIRADLWRMWQPDIVLNPHGYPSHEWVQLFAGYTAWVKSKRAQARDWWIPRGWFMPAFEFINDERFPSHGKAASELKDRIASGVHESFGEINKRMYRRYEKYTGKTLDLHQEVLIQSRPCASQPDPNSFGFMTRYPEVTFFEGLSEAPDEVASGDWLSLLCAAGLQFSIAHARFLADLPSGVLRTRWEMNGKVVFAIRRQRLPS